MAAAPPRGVRAQPQQRVLQSDVFRRHPRDALRHTGAVSPLRARPAADGNRSGHSHRLLLVRRRGPDRPGRLAHHHGGRRRSASRGPRPLVLPAVPDAAARHGSRSGGHDGDRWLPPAAEILRLWGRVALAAAPLLRIVGRSDSGQPDVYRERGARVEGRGRGARDRPALRRRDDESPRAVPLGRLSGHRPHHAWRPGHGRRADRAAGPGARADSAR